MEYDSLAREWHLEDSIKELDSLNKKMARLLLRKEELTEEIIAHIGHEHEGQRSYEYNIWKIEVKTPVTYSLNKKLYESAKYKLPYEYNPIKETMAYTVDKKQCEYFLNNSPSEIRDLLIELIEKKPGKASICLKERV